VVCSLWISIRTDNLFPFIDEPRSVSFNLSKGTKLQDVVFRLGSLKVGWVTLALQTVTPKHRDLRRITIDALPYLTQCINVDLDIRTSIGEGVFGQWLDLDCLLVHLWESRSIRLRLIQTWKMGNGNVEVCIASLLPKMMKRGPIDLVG